MPTKDGRTKLEEHVVSSRRAVARHSLTANSPPPARRPSHDRIMQGALRAITMRGPTLLSMVDVCEAAGVSRATLYRHFAHKEDLLAAVAEHISESFTSGVRQVAVNIVDPVELLRAVLMFTWTFTTRFQTRPLLEVEPRFVIGFLEANFEHHAAVFNEVLAVAYDALEEQAGIEIDRALISELLLRSQHSTVLIRAGHHWDCLPATLAALFAAFVARPSRTKTRQRMPRKVAG
jgi:AcrR family transcriptional regulator